MSLSEIGYKGEQNDTRKDVADMISQELKQSVITAMHKLKPQQQNVLFLRCYEGLKYSDGRIVRELVTFEIDMNNLSIFFRGRKYPKEEKILQMIPNSRSLLKYNELASHYLNSHVVGDVVIINPKDLT